MAGLGGLPSIRRYSGAYQEKEFITTSTHNPVNESVLTSWYPKSIIFIFLNCTMGQCFHTIQ